MKIADRFASRGYSFKKKNKLGDRIIKQLLNSVIAKYRDLSVSRRSIIDLLATDKSRCFAQPRPIIVNYFSNLDARKSGNGFMITARIETFQYHFNHFDKVTVVGVVSLAGVVSVVGVVYVVAVVTVVCVVVVYVAAVVGVVGWCSICSLCSCCSHCT